MTSGELSEQPAASQPELRADTRPALAASGIFAALPEPPWPVPDPALQDVFAALLASGGWGQYRGPHCEALQQALAEYHGVEQVVLCSSGTAATELALRGVGVQPGDEVVLAAYDYKANFVNVLAVGATPVLVDTLPDQPVLDVQQLSAALSPRTRAILCSHLHGCLAPVRQICELAAAQGIAVIEDACQAPGARVAGARAGTTGAVGVLSFGGSKLLTAGRGGAVLTGDASIAQRIRLYTERGNTAYPLSEMQAAVLLPQLQQLDARHRQRWHSVQHLQQQLQGLPGLQLVLSPEDAAAGDSPAFYKLALQLSAGRQRADSEAVSAAARRWGVALDAAFPALHRIHSRRRFRAVGELPHAARLHDQLLTLHHPVLLVPELLDQVAAVLRGIISERPV